MSEPDKVFIVFEQQSYEDYVVVKVFSSEEKAGAWIDKQPPDEKRGWPDYERPGNLTIEAWDIDNLDETKGL